MNNKVALVEQLRLMIHKAHRSIRVARRSIDERDYDSEPIVWSSASQALACSREAQPLPQWPIDPLGIRWGQPANTFQNQRLVHRIKPPFHSR